MKLVIDAVGISTGGSITILNNILYYLSKIDSTLEIIVFIEKTSINNHFIFNNNQIKIKTTNNKSLVKKIFWQQFELNRRTKDLEADLILSLTNIGSFFPKIPQVVYFHQALLFIPTRRLYTFFNFSYFFRFLILKIFVWLGFLKAKTIITQTISIKKDIVKQMPYIQNKIYSIHSGTPKIFENNKSNWSIPKKIQNEFKIIYIAHPAEYKNFYILFETAKLAKKQGIKFKFLLTLDKKSTNSRYQKFIEEYLKIITIYKIENYIYFIDSLKNNTEIKEAYQFTDVVIHPSVVESFPQTFTEAMYYGKPLISINLPYAKEIAGDASLFFEPNNPSSLLNSIQLYINSKTLLDSMSKKSKERSEIFNPMRKWRELYNLLQIIGEHK